MGFVGGTAFKAFEKVNGYQIHGYDINESLATASLETTCKSDMVFIAVPTPMDISTGECHLDLVYKSVDQVRSFRKDNWIYVKSTVLPGTTADLAEAYGRVCFNPEFLTEANAYEDFVDLQYQLFGITGKEAPDVSLFLDAYTQQAMKCRDTVFLDATTTEMIKYTRNCYLATRLSFFNEIKQISDKLGVDYDILRKWAGKDPRVQNVYNKVDPENPGWGLSCLPKDLNAMKAMARSLGIDPKVMNAAWEKNLEVRKVRDWEDMSKAVVKNDEDSI